MGFSLQQAAHHRSLWLDDTKEPSFTFGIDCRLKGVNFFLAIDSIG
jgi:hypothetical protein